MDLDDHVPSSSSRSFRHSLNNNSRYEEQPAYLKLLDNWDISLDKKIVLIPPKITLGRAINNDIVMNVSDKSKSLGFSRHHCEFFLQDNKWHVRNFSPNGLRVNETELMKNEEKELENSDFIALLRVDGPVYEYREPTYNSIVQVENVDGTPTPSDLSDDDEFFDCTENPISELESEKEALNLARTQLKMLEIENKLLQYKSVDTDKEEQEKIEHERRNLDEALKELDDVKENSYKTVMDTMMTHFKCPICNSLPITPVILNCGHTLCSFCLSQHQKIKPNSTPCPKCNYEISNSKPHICLRNFVSNAIEILPKEYELERDRQVAERAKEIAIVAEKEKVEKQEESSIEKSKSDSGTTSGTTNTIETSDDDDEEDDDEESDGSDPLL